jgi:signal transduction histidine kinase
VFRSLIGLGFAIAIIRGLEIFDVETNRIIENMEQKQILATERERIGRELHDGAIQKVYTAGLLVESATKQVDGDHPVLLSRLEKAQAVLNQAIQDLRRSLGELYTSPGTEPLAEALSRLTSDPRFRSMVDLSLDLDFPSDESLAPTRTEDVLAVANEALSNVVRHSRARHVKIQARRSDDRFLMDIIDDGVSIQADPKPGYGLRNMRDRARLLGGEIEIAPIGSHGTRVSLNIPWKDER